MEDTFLYRADYAMNVSYRENIVDQIIEKYHKGIDVGYEVVKYCYNRFYEQENFLLAPKGSCKKGDEVNVGNFFISILEVSNFSEKDLFLILNNRELRKCTRHSIEVAKPCHLERCFSKDYIDNNEYEVAVVKHKNNNYFRFYLARANDFKIGNSYKDGRVVYIYNIDNVSVASKSIIDAPKTYKGLWFIKNTK